MTPRLLTLLLCLGLSSPTLAKDMSGRFGIGGHFEGAPLFGALSARYWVGNLALHGFVGLDYLQNDPDAPPPDSVEHEPLFVVRTGIRALYAMTRTQKVNFFIGAGFSGTFGKGSRFESGGWQPFESEHFIDGVLGFEAYLGEHLALSSMLKFSYEIGNVQHANHRFGLPALLGSFHWYF